MSDYRVSSRYAKSLVELSHAQKSLDTVFQDILLFIETADSNRELKVLLKNPVIRHLDKRSILEKLFKSRVSEVTMSFFDIICRKNRESLLYSIAKEFIRQYNEFKGIQTARVTTAIKLNKELLNEFEEIVLEISGKKSVNLEEVIEPDLIGGFILSLGDRQIDDSISGKLNKIRRQLTT